MKLTLKKPKLKANMSPIKGIQEKNAIKLPYLSILILKLNTLSFFILNGFKTKFFSFFPAATMFVAAFVVHLGDPFSRIEKAILFLAVFVFFMISGPGKYSIDKYNS